NDIVRRSEIQAGSSGSKTDEEEIIAACLKGANPPLAFLGGGLAVQVFVRDPAFVQPFLEESQMLDKLTEDEGAMAVLPKFIHQVVEGFVLGAVLCRVRADQCGMTRRLAQLGECSENRKAVLAFGSSGAVSFCGRAVHRLLQVPSSLGSQRFVEGSFTRLRLHLKNDLRLLWKLCEHFALGASQDERPHKLPEGLPSAPVSPLGDRSSVAFGEGLLTSQKTRIGKMHQAPEIEEAVLQRCSSRDNALFGLQSKGGFRPLRSGILDRLGFIQDSDAELAAAEKLGLPLKHPVGRHKDVSGRKISHGRCAIRFSQVTQTQAGREAPQLSAPMSRNGGGGNHQRGAF